MKKLVLIVFAGIIALSCTKPTDKTIFDPLNSKEIEKINEEFGNAKFEYKKYNFKILDLIMPLIEAIQTEGEVSVYNKTMYGDITYGQVIQGTIQTLDSLKANAERKERAYSDAKQKVENYRSELLRKADSIVKPFTKKYSNDDWDKYNYTLNRNGKADRDMTYFYAEKIIKEHFWDFKDQSYELYDYIREGDFPEFDYTKYFNEQNPNIIKFYSAIDQPFSLGNIKLNLLIESLTKSKK